MRERNSLQPSACPCTRMIYHTKSSHLAALCTFLYDISYKLPSFDAFAMSFVRFIIQIHRIWRFRTRFCMIFRTNSRILPPSRCHLYDLSYKSRFPHQAGTSERFHYLCNSRFTTGEYRVCHKCKPLLGYNTRDSRESPNTAACSEFRGHRRHISRFRRTAARRRCAFPLTSSGRVRRRICQSGVGPSHPPTSHEYRFVIFATFPFKIISPSLVGRCKRRSCQRRNFRLHSLARGRLPALWAKFSPSFPPSGDPRPFQFIFSS